jgi:hypothetical protein
MNSDIRAALGRLAAEKYDPYFRDGAAVRLTPEERALAKAYPDTLRALFAHERERGAQVPEDEVPTTNVVEWWTAPSNHVALGKDNEIWPYRTLAYRSEAACLDAMEAWARGVAVGPRDLAEKVFHAPTYIPYEDDLRCHGKGKGRLDSRLTRAWVERDTDKRGNARILLCATWEVRLVAVREDVVTIEVDGVKCQGKKPVETVIDDWHLFAHDRQRQVPAQTSWALEPEHHTLDLKWAPESPVVGA